MWAHVQVVIDRKGVVLERWVVRELDTRESRKLERELARDLTPVFQRWLEREAVSGVRA